MIESSDSAAGAEETNGTATCEQHDDRNVAGRSSKPHGGAGHFAELRAIEAAFDALRELDEDAQRRAMNWLLDALGLADALAPAGTSEDPASTSFSQGSLPQADHEAPSVRDFMSHKKPQSGVERVACLAYYLARYRGVRHFRTNDIASLNTEAASAKFANASRDVDRADRQNGFIVSAGNRMKQLTIRGEAFVDALPDRDAAKLALDEHAYRRKRFTGAGRKNVSPVETVQ